MTNAIRLAMVSLMLVVLAAAGVFLLFRQNFLSKSALAFFGIMFGIRYPFQIKFSF
jgi:hypothetical protein